MVAFALAYLKFWLRRPAKARPLFFVAGAVYFGSAIGVEAFNAWYDTTFDSGLIAVMTNQLEEFFERLGAIIFS